MITVCIDGGEIQSLRQAMQVIAQALDFPEHFGYNYDALYDCLGGVCQQTVFVFKNEQELLRRLEQDAYMLKIVLDDAVQENPFLSVQASEP